MIICKFENGRETNLRHVVVDVIVLHDNKILLVKRTKKILEGGKWGIVGGYVQRDETVRQAAEREIFEETGWRVKDVTFLRTKDKPDRPHEDRQNIAFVFFCSATQKEGRKDWESDKMDWFDLNSIPSKNEIAFDQAEDIELYKKYLKKKFSLPAQNII